jgi:hypothetical protein
MPIGRPLRLQPGQVTYDLAYLREMFALHQTRCETPECFADPNPADNFYHTVWSFIWICSECHDIYTTLPPRDKLQWDRLLAEHMYELMLRRSYNHMNEKSGFALEAAILKRQALLKKIKRSAPEQRAAEQRELRNQIRESKTKVGAPDDELLVARERQDLRAKLGMPIPSRPRRNHIGILRSKLVVSTQPPEETP